jgi:hypothetical protein
MGAAEKRRGKTVGSGALIKEVASVSASKFHLKDLWLILQRRRREIGKASNL